MMHVEKPHAQRGQTLPILIFAVLTAITLIAVVLNLGDRLAWQIRAQTAADQAADAEIAVQAQQWNRMEAMLSLGSLEEFRSRVLLNGLLLAGARNGYCNAQPAPDGASVSDAPLDGNATANPPNACYYDYYRLVGAFNQSVKRYTKLVILLQQSTAQQSFDAQRSDALRLVADMTSSTRCGTSAGLDCAFTFYTGAPYGSFTQRSMATMQAYGQFTGSGRVCGSCKHFAHSNFMGPMAQNGPLPTLFTPAIGEVTVCHTVQPLITRLIGVQLAPFRFVARSAATAAVTTEELWEPGGSPDPYASAPGAVFEPPEHYALPPPSGDFDWYDPSFGREYEDYTASGSNTGFYAYQPHLYVPIVAWWGALPIHPAVKPIDPAALPNCTSVQ